MLWPAAAAAERLVLSLSTNLVAVGSTYTGARLVAFGVIERDAQTVSRAGPYDVVVTVRGPREAVTIRRKERLGPIWLNRAQQKFVQVPSFLAVMSTRPLTEVASEIMRRRFRLGIEAVVSAPEFTIERGVEDDPFRTALVRLKGRERLYFENPRAVTFVAGEFFRAPIPLPATAPVGNYDVEVSLVADGIVVARRNASFELVKTGLEEQITEFARDRPVLSGFTAAGMALFFGWLASVIFRRD
nr:TIGR02186 family protein [Enterovirga sp. DB1703]